MKLLAYFLLSIGISSLAFSTILYWQRNNPDRLSFDVSFQKPAQQIVKTSTPKRIIIPKISLNLPIIASNIKNGEWETTKKGVSYLQISPIPGETGNSVIYGHNFDNLFGRLPNLNPGDIIEIEYEDHTKKQFIIHYTQVVTPKQVEVVKPTTDTRLTLYTCTGFLDSKRFVVIAMPKV